MLNEQDKDECGQKKEEKKKKKSEMFMVFLKEKSNLGKNQDSAREAPQ